MKLPEVNEKINLPEGVTAKFENNILTIKGEKGENSKVFSHPKINIKLNGK